MRVSRIRRAYVEGPHDEDDARELRCVRAARAYNTRASESSHLRKQGRGRERMILIVAARRRHFR